MTTEEKYALHTAQQLCKNNHYSGQLKVLERIELILEYTDTPKAYEKAKQLQSEPYKIIECPHCKDTRILKIKRWLNKRKIK